MAATNKWITLAPPASQYRILLLLFCKFSVFSSIVAAISNCVVCHYFELHFAFSRYRPRTGQTTFFALVQINLDFVKLTLNPWKNFVLFLCFLNTMTV
jgi:hypothetical protein